MMMPKSEIEKKIRQANIWIAVLLFLSALNIGIAIYNAARGAAFWIPLLSTVVAIFPAWVAYKWILLKLEWRRIQHDVELFEKLNAN